MTKHFKVTSDWALPSKWNQSVRSSKSNNCIASSCDPEKRTSFKKDAQKYAVPR